MGVSVEVDSANFATEVLEKSHQKPVLIDFFAQWCGPCQMLKPILEKLAQEYDFVLAKVDIDQNPDLASTYHIEGVPDVRIAQGGEVRPGFVGVLPEPQLRSLLSQELQLQSDLEVGLKAVNEAIATQDVEQAKQMLNQLIQTYPQDQRLVIVAARFLISQDRLESAEKLLAAIHPNDPVYAIQAKALKDIIQLRHECQNPVIETDLDALYLKAASLTLENNYEAALQVFLDLVSRDRRYKNDGARKAMITIFNLLGDEHPLTREYRKQLMLALY